jgi:hypothetical protein
MNPDEIDEEQYVENLISLQMEKDDELNEFLPCAYYVIAFGEDMGEAWFVKCGISNNYHKRYGDYERWAKKEGIHCWEAGSFMFHDRKDAREYEQMILNERLEKKKTTITFGGKGNKRQERIMSRFPHQTEMFGYDYRPCSNEVDNAYSWEEYWEGEGCIADFFDIDHPMWKRFGYTFVGDEE